MVLKTGRETGKVQVKQMNLAKLESSTDLPGHSMARALKTGIFSNLSEIISTLYLHLLDFQILLCYQLQIESEESAISLIYCTLAF